MLPIRTTIPVQHSSPVVELMASYEWLVYSEQFCLYFQYYSVVCIEYRLPLFLWSNCYYYRRRGGSLYLSMCISSGENCFCVWNDKLQHCCAHLVMIYSCGYPGNRGSMSYMSMLFKISYIALAFYLVHVAWLFICISTENLTRWSWTYLAWHINCL